MKTAFLFGDRGVGGLHVDPMGQSSRQGQNIKGWGDRWPEGC